MKKFFAFLVASMMCFCTLLTGCTTNDNANANDGAKDGSSYDSVIDNTVYDIVLEEGKTYSNQISTLDNYGFVVEKNYNSNLFYVNDSRIKAADPFVFQCTDETDAENYGKFFMYSTPTRAKSFTAWESTDMVSWKQKAPAYTVPADGWEYADTWAPEVIYDKDAVRSNYGLDENAPGTGVYFIYYSATPCTRFNNFTNMADGTKWQLGLAVSTSPYGPFTMYNGEEHGAKIGGVDYSTRQNYATYTTYKDTWNTFANAGRQGDVITNDDCWFNQSAARASLAFQWKHKNKAGKWVDPNGNEVAEGTANATFINEGAQYMVVDESLGGMPCFDANPFVDPVTGQKYLFFSVSGRGQPTQTDANYLPLFQVQSTYAVKMYNNDWSQIDYSSITRISRAQCNFISQAAADAYEVDAKEFDASQFVNGYDEGDNLQLTLGYADAEKKIAGTSGVNEGPCVLYNEKTGLYYLLVSVGSYNDASYSVVQSVAYSPMGPYRKLTLEEGGVLLSNYANGASNIVVSPGHNSVIKIGDQLAICYHSIINYIHGAARGVRVDRMLYTPNGNGMQVLYVNGPTKSPQLKFYGADMDYKNIIGDATVSVQSETGVNVDALTDGIITMHSSGIHTFTKEFEFTETEIKMTISFDDYRTICGLMFYNSANYKNAFWNIKRIEMDAKIDNSLANVIIKSLKYDWDNTVTFNSIRSGNAAIAVFNDLQIKEITVTVKNWNIPSEGQDASLYSGKTALSELVVIGK